MQVPTQPQARKNTERLRSTEANAPKVIYDLQGRRVERVTKTGIYIVNGKKMVIRK